MPGVQYVSTRGAGRPVGFSDVALDGLAADGGLMVPQTIPALLPGELSQWRSLSYPELAKRVFAKFIADIDPAALARLVDATYTAKVFGSQQITPLTMLNARLGLLHLSNGPTLAFKDIAMQWLAALFEHLLFARGQTLKILGATSGDTGSAALYAMRNRQRIDVFMLSPYGRMSPFQAAQMYSVNEPNCVNLAVRGVFDEAQDIVKQINQDAAFKAEQHIGTVNSINWARVVAQVVYYFKGYFAATTSNDERISFAVPSGNFGNIYAGHIARRMGLPIDRLICATNENDVLDEFFRTGVYRVRAPHLVHATSSPSMDISKASNFERLIFDLYDGDASRVNEDWQRLASGGEFRIDTQQQHRLGEQFGFISGASSHAQRIATIRAAYRDFGVVIDPHTADGLAVANQVRCTTPIIVLETAQPAKFEATIIEALGFAPARPPNYLGLEQLPQKVEVIDATAAAVRYEIERHGHELRA